MGNMGFEEISELAKKRAVMPDGALFTEQWAYQALRGMYQSFRYGAISEEQGRKEKAQIRQNFEKNQLWETIFRRQGAMAVELGILLKEADNHGCEICKRMAKLLDGRLTAALVRANLPEMCEKGTNHDN